MRFQIAIAASATIVMACRGTDTPREPESIVIVDDSSGRITNSAIPSPDGTRLVYTKVVAGRSQLFVSDADGSNPRQLTNGVWDSDAVWSWDGKWIAYQNEDPDFDVYVVASDGSVPPRLVVGGRGNDDAVEWLRDNSGLLINRAGVGDDHPVVALLAGGERRVGPVMQGNVHSTWSHDGALLLFDVHQGAGGTIWAQDSAAGSKPRQLTTEGHETGIGPTAWSPDGKQVAYVSQRTGTQDIWILDIASGQTRQLTNDIRDDNTPRWSPDGRLIAFLSDRGGQRDLWVMPSAGGGAVRLTNDAAIEGQPRWALDGKSVYYSSTQNALEFQFAPIAGGPARTVYAWGEWSIGSARLSPDGKTIVYDSPRVGNGDVFALPAAGGEPATVGSSPLNDNSPRFSPDGTQIALLSNRGGTYDIWIVPTTGGEARNATASPGDEGEPVWSPDGSQIAFASSRDVGGSDLWVISSSGGVPRRLTHDNIRPASYQWSPDGQYLYFHGQNRGGAAARGYFRIAVSGGRLEPLGVNARIFSSRLSRDGTRVVYNVFERGWAFTHVMPAAGGPTRRITADTSNVYQPDAFWSMGDSLLVVPQLDLAGNRDNAEILTYRLSDGRWTQLTHTVGHEDVFGITPDGKEILVALRNDKSQVRRVSVPPLPGDQK